MGLLIRWCPLRYPGFNAFDGNIINYIRPTLKMHFDSKQNKSVMTNLILTLYQVSVAEEITVTSVSIN